MYGTFLSIAQYYWSGVFFTHTVNLKKETGLRPAAVTLLT